jgi:uncharacterized RmlC-like cupin family protein
MALIVLGAYAVVRLIRASLATKEETMRNVLVAATAVVTILAVPRAITRAENAEKPDDTKKGFVAVTPQDVKWFTPTYYKDGRQRAQLLGDSSKGGPWIDRVKIPSNSRVLAHTHPEDELVTVIEGVWYVGQGEKFDAAKLKPYPAGSLVVIPAGLPHFLATKNAITIVQFSGNGVFRSDFLEK